MVFRSIRLLYRNDQPRRPQGSPDIAAPSPLLSRRQAEATAPLTGRDRCRFCAVRVDLFAGTVQLRMNDFCADDATVACPLFRAEYGGSTPTSALHLRLAKITPKLACSLNALWHSRLPIITVNNIIGTGMHICFAAECGNRYYAVAIYSAPIARFLNDRKTLELRRLAVSPDAPKNTATRVLAITRRLIRQRLPHIDKLISYQDCQVHTGTIYKADGWTPTKINKSWDWRRCQRGRMDNNAPQAASPKQRWEFVL